jgi:sugar phosphate isomerase/epimerase
MQKRELAVQLYTLRNETQRDFPGTLRQVADAGYGAVEFAGFGSHTAAELKQVLDETGMVAAGAHIGLQQLESRLDQVIEEMHTLGARHLACPSLPQNRRQSADDFRRAGEELARYGEQCKAAGLQLSYHNHDFEFKQFDGRYGIDLLAEAADPELLKLQPDLGWVAYAGVDPVEFLRRYSGRVPTVHFKDMIKEPERYDVPNGEGILPIPELVAAGREAGTEWFIVELDAPREPPIECIRRSAQFLNGLGVR